MNAKRRIEIEQLAERKLRGCAAFYGLETATLRHEAGGFWSVYRMRYRDSRRWLMATWSQRLLAAAARLRIQADRLHP